MRSASLYLDRLSSAVSLVPPEADDRFMIACMFSTGTSGKLIKDVFDPTKDGPGGSQLIMVFEYQRCNSLPGISPGIPTGYPQKAALWRRWAGCLSTTKGHKLPPCTQLTTERSTARLTYLASSTSRD
jgi:hypothetical protein